MYNAAVDHTGWGHLPRLTVPVSHLHWHDRDRPLKLMLLNPLQIHPSSPFAVYKPQGETRATDRIVENQLRGVSHVHVLVDVAADVTDVAAVDVAVLDVAIRSKL